MLLQTRVRIWGCCGEMVHVFFFIERESYAKDLAASVQDWAVAENQSSWYTLPGNITHKLRIHNPYSRGCPNYMELTISVEKLIWREASCFRWTESFLFLNSLCWISHAEIRIEKYCLQNLFFVRLMPSLVIKLVLDKARTGKYQNLRQSEPKSYCQAI